MNETLFDQAAALHARGQLAEAEELYRHVVASDPRNAVALINWGHTLNGLRQFGSALEAYDRSLALDASHTILHLARGDVLQWLLRYDEALESYNRFLGFAPDHAEAWNGRGLTLQNLGRLEEALDSYRHAEVLDPALAAPRLNRALCHLLMQDFAQGLLLYEWRKRMPQPMEARAYAQPLWTGAEDIRGRILFAYVEQGLGDAIQFYRYVSCALERGARVILSVPDRLVALLKTATPAVELIGWGQTPAQFDFHIPLASIPLAVGMRAGAIPASDRYLAALESPAGGLRLSHRHRLAGQGADQGAGRKILSGCRAGKDRRSAGCAAGQPAERRRSRTARSPAGRHDGREIRF
jgi:Tfp pilus assembly protein PilF